MSARKRNLQPYQIKGVDALLGETETIATGHEKISLSEITLSKQQPRRYFDAQSMQELIESVKQHGILQPLLVRPKGSKYELVAGERRYRAATAAGLEKVPVTIRELTDEEAFQFAILENLQREDLNPVEETEGILQLAASRLKKAPEDVVTLLNQAAHPERNSVDNVIHRKEWQILQEVFTSVGRFSPESFRTNRLPLLNLPEDVLDVLRQGKLEYTKARAISRVKDQAQRQALLKAAIADTLSLSQIKEKISALNPVSLTPPDQSPSLKQQVDEAYRQVKKSKVWNNPKKQKRLEKLLAELQTLIEGET